MGGPFYFDFPGPFLMVFTIRNLNEKVFVNTLSTIEENIRLTIYNEKGETVYFLNEKNAGDYQKVLNLENLGVGTYNVIVTTGHFSSEVKVSL